MRLVRLSPGQRGDGARRAPWGPGVITRRDARRQVERLILAHLRVLDRANGLPLRVAELGCGVCESLCFIAQQLPVAGTGITPSPAQVELARRRIVAQGLVSQVRCVQGDLCGLPAGLGPIDLAFGIECLLHAADGAAFFAQAARLIRPGGLLLLCEDLLAPPAARQHPAAARWVQLLRDGRGSNVSVEADVQQLARQVGFELVESLDLTPYLELARLRTYATGALVRCLGWLPISGSYWSRLYGGHALQVALKRGWVQRQVMVWRRA